MDKRKILHTLSEAAEDVGTVNKRTAISPNNGKSDRPY
jgi:hypothetical protein